MLIDRDDLTSPYFVLKMQKSKLKDCRIVKRAILHWYILKQTTPKNLSLLESHKEKGQGAFEKDNDKSIQSLL